MCSSVGAVQDLAAAPETNQAGRATSTITFPRGSRLLGSTGYEGFIF